MVSLFLLCFLCICNGEDLVPVNCSAKLHDHDAVQQSVTKANMLLQRHSAVQPKEDRLAVMILFTSGLLEEHNPQRVKYLRCSLKKLLAFMQPTTPLDIYVWVKTQPGETLIIPDWLAAIPRVNVMEVVPSTWLVPCGLKDKSEWTFHSSYSLDYYLMGRWRLAFSFDFIKAMGYAYSMQFDDDSILNAPVTYNIVDTCRKGGLYMAAFAHPLREVPGAVNGLPELTRYWLLVNNYTAPGTLFQHLGVHGHAGLTSDSWDRMIYRGNGLVTSTEYWFLPQVQAYLKMIITLGIDIEGRWQEQGVMNMMRLVFIPEEKFKQLPGVDIGHNRRDKMNYVNWCVKSGYA
jgi:hypothetical protein